MEENMVEDKFMSQFFEHDLMNYYLDKRIIKCKYRIFLQAYPDNLHIKITFMILDCIETVKYDAGAEFKVLAKRILENLAPGWTVDITVC